MTTAHRVVPNAYKDSVALLAISSKLLALDGINAASVVMATPTNLENLVDAGLAGGLTASPSDLVVAVGGHDAAACEAALAAAGEMLSEKPAEDGAAVEEPPGSIQAAAMRDPSLNLALVSVPGDYAAAEALKAVKLGMSVMIFSDNVPVERELEIKRAADERDLIVMGPDCGTAIVNGIPLGFANVVRRGPIGVVGASGTGTQEVTARIHELGSGVSQAIGTGGHDLAEAIGGISMLRGMRWLEDDPDTKVVVLVSKPPHPTVAAAVLAQAAGMSTPVVSIFLGADPDASPAGGILAAGNLAESADLAVALAEGRPAERAGLGPGAEAAARLDEIVAGATEEQRFVRGIFSGGTFCFEAQLILRAAGLDAWSNTPVQGNAALADIATSREHTIIDMGDDQFTQGRPHPMIDPGLRDERLAEEAADPTTAVLLVDVVLGYGSTMDPVSGLVAVLEGAQPAAIVHVCGTSADPQDRAAIIERLRACGALVAETNAEAASWAAYVATGLAAR